MEVKNCLKIQYRGLLRYIICDVGSRYEDILNLVIERFNIPAEYHQSLRVANDHGYIFEKHLFEYFILLFPNPEIIFYIRLDYNKVATGNDIAQTDSDDSRIPFGYSKRNNKRCHFEDDDDDGETQEYHATPVHRQNCFLGEMPTNAATLQRHRSEDFSRKVAKRMRLMDSKQKKPRRLSNPAKKRSLRI